MIHAHVLVLAIASVGQSPRRVEVVIEAPNATSITSFGIETTTMSYYLINNLCAIHGKGLDREIPFGSQDDCRLYNPRHLLMTRVPGLMLDVQRRVGVPEVGRVTRSDNMTEVQFGESPSVAPFDGLLRPFDFLLNIDGSIAGVRLSGSNGDWINLTTIGTVDGVQITTAQKEPETLLSGAASTMTDPFATTYIKERIAAARLENGQRGYALATAFPVDPTPQDIKDANNAIYDGRKGALVPAWQRWTWGLRIAGVVAIVAGIAIVVRRRMTS